jgi:hypothetical protein
MLSWLLRFNFTTFSNRSVVPGFLRGSYLLKKSRNIPGPGAEEKSVEHYSDQTAFHIGFK